MCKFCAFLGIIVFWSWSRFKIGVNFQTAVPVCIPEFFEDMVVPSEMEMVNSQVAYQSEDTQSSPDLAVSSYDFLYKLIKRLLKYHEVAGEDPHMHLKEFHVVCSTFKPTEIAEDWVKLKAFPFSLRDTANDWLYYKTYSTPITSWTEMQRSFLEFFTASMVSFIRKQICTIEQGQYEELDHYWERFNSLCIACPNHQISVLVYSFQMFDCLWFNCILSFFAFKFSPLNPFTDFYCYLNFMFLS